MFCANNMSHQSWPVSQNTNKQKGICSVCKAVRQLHLKDNTIHLHGPRQNPCPGSHKAPAPSNSTQSHSSSVLSVDTVLSHHSITATVNGSQEMLPSHSLSSPASQFTPFDHHRFRSSIIKHIPKSARPSCNAYLTDLLSKLCASYDNISHWQALLDFAPTFLFKPRRTGKRHNLTSIIKKRFADINTTSATAAANDSIRQNPTMQKTASLASRIAAKMEDGDVSGAIRLLHSEDKPIYDSDDVYQNLIDRHPPASTSRKPFNDPQVTSALQIAEKDVLRALRSFPAGSSGGPDGLRSKHLLDLCNCKITGQAFLTSVTSFINMLLEGKCHPDIAPILFGGNLTALIKKTGGIRPIAVGYTWRRIAAKCANTYAIGRLGDYFTPTQFGVGVSGGCEAVVHATRRFIESMPNDFVIAKLDFANAFNNIHRDAMLEAVFINVPEIYKFCHLSYSQPSLLRYGSKLISSEEGSQQGDPLGPLLFCITIQPLLRMLCSKLVVGYIDDITIGGHISTVVKDVETIKLEGPSLGLHLNINKCELISSIKPVQSQTLNDFIAISPSDASLLGAPLFTGASQDAALNKKFAEFNRLSTNIKSINAHDALLILKAASSTSHILFMLRCSPCHGNSILIQIDEVLRSNISHIANVTLSDCQWMQASLPVKAGGLGIRRAHSLALPAYLASATSTSALQDLILTRSEAPSDKYRDLYCSVWSSTYNRSLPLNTCKQRVWDEPGVNADIDLLFTTASQQDKSRLLAVTSPHSSDWLHAIPIGACGLRLENEDIRVAVGLRLGSALCQAHQCPCGTLVEVNGLHGLSCKLNSGKHSRHATINDIIYRACVRADIPAVKEPTGLSRLDGKRPDGGTLIPWTSGKCLLWDVTIADTMAHSYSQISSISAGAVAERSSTRKEEKYSELAKSHIFVPIAIETLGPICSQGLSFLRDLGRRMSAISGDIRETAFLFQRLSVAIQRFNCVLFRNSFIADIDE